MKKKLITRSKDILGGISVFSGTRVPARALIDYLQANRSLEEFLDDFPSVTKTQAIGVLDMANSHIMNQPYERAD